MGQISSLEGNESLDSMSSTTASFKSFMNLIWMRSSAVIAPIHEGQTYLWSFSHYLKQFPHENFEHLGHIKGSFALPRQITHLKNSFIFFFEVLLFS